MRSMVTFSLVLSIFSTSVLAQQQLQIVTPPGGASTVPPEASYGLGYDIGTQLASGGLTAGDISSAQFVKGLMDALAAAKPSLDEATVRKAMEQLGQVVEQRNLVAQQQRQANNAAYLAANKKKDGVIETDSGLQYEVLKSGNGAMPTAQSQVTVHYEGKFTDGQVFDSSIQRGEPATFGVTQVIKGWTEALLSMKVGDRWRLVIPSDLAYGPQGRGNIPPNEPLVFEVELLSVQ